MDALGMESYKIGLENIQWPLIEVRMPLIKGFLTLQKLPQFALLYRVPNLEQLADSFWIGSMPFTLDRIMRFL